MTSIEVIFRTCTTSVPSLFPLRPYSRYCAENDIEFVQAFVERGRSAKTKERPELYRLLDFCAKKRNQIDVVVHKLDRLARNSDDHGYLKVTLAG